MIDYQSYGSQTWPIKWNAIFFQAIVPILLYGCTTRTLTKRMEKKLNGNNTRMQRVKWNKSWRQDPTNQQLYSHLPPIAKTIQIRRTRHAGLCWRSKYELISDVLLWTPSYERAKVGRPARTYIQQLCADTDIAMDNNRKRWKIEKGGGKSQRYPCWWRDVMMMMMMMMMMIWKKHLNFTNCVMILSRFDKPHLVASINFQPWRRSLYLNYSILMFSNFVGYWPLKEPHVLAV